ncbi:conserved membrane hypothetical protein [Candidatus Roizmanbacteria bacterium]|nr:conserved membrane hypothetical protein [Candidatus Roizmanbacteria bacterium]
MRKFLSLFVIVFFTLLFFPINPVSAQTLPQTPFQIAPQLCGCPSELNNIYKEKATGETCINTRDSTAAFTEFNQNPRTKHLWIEDSEVTAQGKSNDRARQFIYWVVTHSAIDNHPVLIKVWSTARNMSYFFVILTAALLGLGIIVGQRTNFETGIKLWPAITKILMSILYISFSATIIFTVIQLSEIIMKFFIENLGGKDLFNIYFSGISQETNYVDFFGCRDLNIRVQEAVKTEMFLLKLTNISYYLMGGMLLLRKIILWFLLFVSPFLAVLLSFSFVKNVGMIWIGVFFQWVFYGPLLALFLGGMASIWKYGIPFVFDFSRVDTAAGYIYPTAINILYGGPAQKLSVTNNGNYVDTFVEYVITLIMLWAVVVFPWWLLRIYRDYCCEGINAMKNMMLSNLNPGHPGSPSPSPTPVPISSNVGVEMKMSRDIGATVKTRIETVEEIKRAKTEDISRSLNIKASNITDIAHFETNKTLNEATNKNINFLKNPIQASTSAERQRYMNIRSELSSRALKADPIASRLIKSFIVAKINIAEKENIIKTLPKTTEALTSNTRKNIEEIIAVSPTVTLDEYEQVKKMWTNTYEKGEIPKTENLLSRSEWVEYDIVLITNTLNKLLSDDKALKAQALDEIGFILPIFLINNLSGDQLVTYLKAKIEAARTVKTLINREKEVTERLKAGAEEKLDVMKPKKKEAEKTMEMKEELKLSNDQ